MHRLQALTRHWRAHPPTHLLVASYLGHKAPGPAASLQPEQEPSGELAALLAQTPVRAGAPAVDHSAWAAAGMT